MLKSWSLYVFVALIAACTAPVDDDQDHILASVHGMNLHLSDAREYLNGDLSRQDSVAQLRSYVEQWVRDALLLHEAELHMPADVDITGLVQDYRESLIVSNYEQQLVQTRLDTVISDTELQQYYEKNKEQYQLEQPIIRCHFVKIKKPVADRRDFRKWWDSESPDDFVNLVNYSNAYAELFMLEDSTWYKEEEIQALMPPGTLSSRNMRRDRSLTFTDDQFEYYLRILESVLSTEIAPLSYIREQAERYIMYTRKLALLESIREDLYEQGMEGDQIKIFVQ